MRQLLPFASHIPIAAAEEGHYDHPEQACAMRRLPPELLVEIFNQCLPTVPSFRATDAPLLLTHVCSWWREYAVNHSTLWDTLYLPSPVEGITNGCIQLCNLWLERSKNRPISVDFHLASDYQPWKITEGHLQAVHQIVRLLIPHSGRIMKLLRVLPRFLLEELRLEDMSILDDLFICDTPEMRPHGRPVVPRNLVIPDTLRCLALRQTCFDLTAFSSLRQLAHLDLWQLQGEGQMSLRTCMTLLRDLSHLESCTLDVALNGFDRKPHNPPIVMPNLTFFFISWDWLVDVGSILDALATPALRRLGLRGPPPTRRQWPHLRNFLRRCRPQLMQLSIKEVGFADILLLECLSACPTLTNLSLSHCSIASDFIKALTLDPRLSAQTYILPRLEYMSLEACDEFEVKDLITMLNTRGRVVPPGGSALRGLRLSFCKRIMESHRVDLETSGIESVVIRVARSPRPHTR